MESRISDLTGDASALHDLLARLRNGEEQAAAEVFDRFAHRLMGLARQKLNEPLRRKEDPEDVVQSVLKSFFPRYAAGQYQLTTWDDLWGLLARITAHKCGNRVVRFQAARRDVRREVSMAPTDDSHASWQLLAHEPTPTQALVLTEILETLHNSLGARDRDIFALHLQGIDNGAISTQLQCSQRTVFRVLERIRQSLESQCEDA